MSASYLLPLLNASVGFSFARVWSSVSDANRMNFVLRAWFGVLVALGANALLQLTQTFMASPPALTPTNAALYAVIGAVVESIVFGLVLRSSSPKSTVASPSTSTASFNSQLSTQSNVSGASSNSSVPAASNAVVGVVDASSKSIAKAAKSTDENGTAIVKKKKKVVKSANGADVEVSDVDSVASSVTSKKKKKLAADAVENGVDETPRKTIKKKVSSSLVDESDVTPKKKVSSIKKKEPQKNYNPAFPPATSADFQQLLDLAKHTPEWTLCHSDSHVKVWEQPSHNPDSHISIVKLETEFHDISALTLYDALHDPDYRKEWDDKMIEGFLIEQIDRHNDVGYYHAKAPPGFANRDWVNQRSWRIRDDREYIIMNHSVIHEKMPEKHGVIRAKSIITGYLVEVLPNGCRLTYCTQNDSRGWIPTWIKNYVTRKFAPSIVEKMHKAAASYEAWKAKQAPPKDGRPWRVFPDDE